MVSLIVDLVLMSFSVFFHPHYLKHLYCHSTLYRRIMLTRSAQRLLGRSRALARYNNEASSNPTYLSSLLSLQGSSPFLSASNGECSGLPKGILNGGAFCGHRMHSTTGLRVAEPMRQGMTEMVPDLAPLPSDIRFEDLTITRSKRLQVCAFQVLRWKEWIVYLLEFRLICLYTVQMRNHTYKYSDLTSQILEFLSRLV